MRVVHGTSYTLEVTGQLWGGARARHEYPLSAEQARQVTPANAHTYAPDFEQVSRAHVRETQRVVCEQTGRRRVR